MCPESLCAENNMLGFIPEPRIFALPYGRARPITTKPLPAMQAALLQYFRANSGRVIHREELAEQVWKQRHYYGSRAIDQAVANLRKQLLRTDEEIKSVWSVGYRFECHRGELKMKN